MTKEIQYSRESIKQLKKMPANTKSLIVSKIRQLAINPTTLANNIKKLQGKEGYRLRVGDYRVVYTEDLQIIAIIRIAPRGGAYD